MTINFKGASIQKEQGGPSGSAAELEKPPELKAPPCIHAWEVRAPRQSYTVEQKHQRLRRSASVAEKDGDLDSANGFLFEGRAAEHNQVADGNDMSGPNDASKLYMVCKKCGRRDRELDHVIRSKEGRVLKVVEVKSGNANIKDVQFSALQELCVQLGATLVYKLQQGAGTPMAVRELTRRGLAPQDIIVI
jgi:hypothetical protein